MVRIERRSFFFAAERCAMPRLCQHVSQARNALLKAREYCQNLRGNPAYRGLAAYFADLEAASPNEREGLLGKYQAEVDRRFLKVLSRYLRALRAVAAAEEDYRSISGSEPPVAVLVRAPETMPIPPAAGIDVEGGFSSRGCAHWEYEGGDPCGSPVVVLGNGRTSPYCEAHLSVCRNPACPSGPNYRIPARFKFCARCRDRSLRRRGR